MAAKAKVRRVGTSLGILTPKDKPAKEIRDILKGTTFHFERKHEDRDEHI